MRATTENQSGRPVMTAMTPGSSCAAGLSSMVTSTVVSTALAPLTVLRRFQIISTKPARYIVPPSARTMYIGRIASSVSVKLG